MTEDTRRSVLEKLATMEGDQAQKLLDKEYAQISSSLQESSEFSEIEGALELLSIFVYRVPDQASKDLSKLIDRLESADIEVSETQIFREYFTNESLQEKAIELLSRLRYLTPAATTKKLFELCNSESAKIKDAANKALEELATIDLHIFSKIRVQPQLDLLAWIEDFSDQEVREYATIILTIFDRFLSSEISGSSWDYDKVTISRGAIPAEDDVRDLRDRSIGFLERMYFLNDTPQWRKSCLATLNSATSTFSPGALTKEGRVLLNENSIAVLRFYKSILPEADLQVVQKVEHYSFWVFYRSSDSEVIEESLDIEQMISLNAEYQIYRDLIGFEGIFGDWRESKSESASAARRHLNERDALAEEWAEKVDKENFDEWEERIVRFAGTESQDLATFPAFYKFMTRLAERLPENVLKLLSQRPGEVERVLIPTMHGIWRTLFRPQLKELLVKWISNGQYLVESSRLMLIADESDIEILERILDEAKKIADTYTLSVLISITVDKPGLILDKKFERIFAQSIEFLTTLDNTDWVNHVRFSYESDSLRGLSANNKDLVLQNLLNRREIDYHTEELLAEIGFEEIELILKFFGQRIEIEKDKKERKYEAVPFQFHTLGKFLSSEPDSVIRVSRSWYDGNYGLFVFRGARFFANVFPEIGPEVSGRLCDLVREGGSQDHEYVLSILRNYQAQTFIHPVCMELVKALPEDDRLLSEVRIALWQTGVTSGEYGFAEALERRAQRLSSWLDSNNKRIREFAEDVSESLRRDAENDRQRTDQEIEIRKFKYEKSD